MRNAFFYQLDKCLPRSLARIPYQAAWLDTRKKLSDALRGSSVWYRNSVKLDSFIVGVSDLDLTVLSQDAIKMDELRSLLAQAKKKWPFLGETNFYYQKDLSSLSQLFNYFELQRDPDLKLLLTSTRQSSEIDKIVFLLRMFEADHKLETDPHLRQKKWIQHMAMMDITAPAFVTRDSLLKILENLLKESPRTFKGILDFLAKKKQLGFDVFHTPILEGYKIAYPYRHLWFHFDNDNTFLEKLNSFEKAVIRGQIDWDICGIYSQSYWLDLNSSHEHLGRLMRVYELISDEAETSARKKIIQLLF